MAMMEQPDMFGGLPREAPREAPRVRRSRVTNDPSRRANQNTARGRRVADLLRGFIEAMGCPTSPIRQADALQAAELTVAAEDARAELLAGRGDLDQVVRIENAARRAVKKLGIAQPQTSPPKRTLADHLRRRAGAGNAGAV